MGRYKETFDLREEAERLDERLDDLAVEANRMDGEDSASKSKREDVMQRAQFVEQQLAGVEWALNPPESEPIDEIAEVTLSALDTGEYAQVQDRTQSVADHQTGTTQSVADGAGRIFFAAQALTDAPFLEEDASFEDRAAAVRQLAPQFVTWIEEQADKLTTPEVDIKNFAERVEEKTSADEPN